MPLGPMDDVSPCTRVGNLLPSTCLQASKEVRPEDRSGLEQPKKGLCSRAHHGPHHRRQPLALLPTPRRGTWESLLLPREHGLEKQEAVSAPMSAQCKGEPGNSCSMIASNQAFTTQKLPTEEEGP